MKFEIINAIVKIIVIVITGILLPIVKEWLSARTQYSKWSQLREYAQVAAQAAEQLYHRIEAEDPDGTLRNNYAMQAIAIMADRLGLALTGAEIKTLIESAVHEVNQDNPAPVGEFVQEDVTNEFKDY